MIDLRPGEAAKTPQFVQHFRSMTDSICCNRPKFDYHASLRSLLADDSQCGLEGALETRMMPSRGWLISRMTNIAADIETAQVTNAMTEVELSGASSPGR